MFTSNHCTNYNISHPQKEKQIVRLPIILIFILSSLVWSEATPPTTTASPISFEQIYSNVKFRRPIALKISPDDTNRQFLLCQRGRIFILPEDETSSKLITFFNIADRKMEENKFEEGLLGFAFHPHYKENKKFYVYYSQQDPKRSVISEFEASSSDPNKADLTTEKVILEIPQPFWNHNSGNLLFGPDGYLYIGVGDGGSRDDKAELTQKLDTLNGKILRIDINSKTDALPYGIPEDNPYVANKEIRSEIWCHGLRNPWGMWIDPDTKNFWCADVGQYFAEEVNLIKKGGNYGWSYKEGFDDFPRSPIQNKAPKNLIDPITTYDRKQGTSITGGYVYRGKLAPSLKGNYIYGDWGTGRIWALTEKEGKLESNQLIHGPIKSKKKGIKPTGFYQDNTGELVVLNWSGGIYRMIEK